LERARRRELSQARRQIQAVDLERFSRFMFRWQHVAPSTLLDGDDATVHAARQLYGVSRPAELWERELFPARAESYDASAIARLIAAGEMVWVGGGARTRRRSSRTSECCVVEPDVLGSPSRTRRSVRPQRRRSTR
jgi:ATP-dependent Lhr-like helicase